MAALFTGADAPDLLRVDRYPPLTRHYLLQKGGAGVKWESGTLSCDMNEDGSIFRLCGSAYANDGSVAWSTMPWIPGTNNTYAGWKTFKVKTPPKAKEQRCCGLISTVNSNMGAQNLNYCHLIVGTDGYVYIPATNVKHKATHLCCCFFGVTLCVDDMTDFGTYVIGDGSK